MMIIVMISFHVALLPHSSLICFNDLLCLNQRITGLDRYKGRM